MREKDNLVTIRQAKPLIQLGLAPNLNPTRLRPADLDMTHADDRMIEEIIAYAADYNQHNVVLLTHDINPILTAKHHGLPCLEIPEEWLLPPETDEKEKAISELRRQVSDLQKNHPQVKISVTGRSEKDLDCLPLTIVKFSRLNKERIDELCRHVRGLNPLEVGPEEQPQKRKDGHIDLVGMIAEMGERRSHTPERRFQQYKNEYARWVSRLAGFFFELPERLEDKLNRTKIKITLENLGTRPAEGVLVEIAFNGGVTIDPPRKGKGDDPRDVDIRIPVPPVFTPYPRHLDVNAAFLPISQGPYLDVASLAIAQRHRDPHVFYYEDGRPTERVSLWRFACDEFRHRASPEEFDLDIVFPVDLMRDVGLLAVKVHANNLPDPEVKRLPIQLAVEERDVEIEVLSLLENMAADG